MTEQNAGGSEAGRLAGLGAILRAPLRRPAAAAAGGGAPVLREARRTAAMDEAGREAPPRDGDRGALLTAPRGRLDVSDDVRRVCALFEDGTFLVHSSHLTNSRVMSIVQRAAQLRPPVHAKPAEPVDVATLFEVYGRDAIDRLSNASGSRERLMIHIERAAAVRASDIQVPLHGDAAVVRYQIDGYLSGAADELLAEEARGLATSAFYLADHGDPVEQPGIEQRISVTNRRNLPDNVLALRLQFAPLGDGRHLNIRLIYADTGVSGEGLDALNLPDEVKQALYLMQQRGEGLVVLAGPTESGKSTTLHYWLVDLSASQDDRITIVSCDDPPEGLDPRILHFPVNGRGQDGRDPFDRAFEVALRVAPHAVRIGECRTALVACKAFEVANTSKIVGTTIHTDEVLSIPSRFVELGVDADIAFAAHRYAGLVAQRRVPLLCRCRQPLDEVAKRDPRRAALAAGFRRAGVETQGLYVRNDKGCTACTAGDSGLPGVKGRELIAEAWLPSAAIMKTLRHDEDAARREWLETGVTSLRLAGYDLLRAGRIGADEYAKFVASPAQLGEDLAVRRAPVREAAE